MADLEETKFFFKEGDDILCYYGKQLYEAKCVKRRMTDYGPEYYVHYKNWKKRWDEWKDWEDVIEVNDINLKHMHRYNEHWAGKLAKKRYRSGSDEENTTSVKHKKERVETVSVNNQLNDETQFRQLKRKRGRPRKLIDEDKKHCSSSEARSHISNNNLDIPKNSLQPVDPMKISTSELTSAQNSSGLPEDDVKKIEYSKDIISKPVEMPLKLKNLVSYDWVMVNYFYKVASFNNDNSVSKLINDYITQLDISNADNWRVTYEYCLCVLNIFNEELHDHCLYKNEKDYKISQQGMSYFLRNRKNTKTYFHKALNSKKPWVHVYGPVYLLRLLGKGIMISRRQKELMVKERSFKLVDGCIDDTFNVETTKLLNFIAENHVKYLLWYDYKRIPGYTPDIKVLRELTEVMELEAANK